MKALRNNETYKTVMSRCYETEQNNLHHIYNVGEHIDQVVSHIPADKKDDEILVMAAMLHDIGKPDVKETKADGTEEERQAILWIVEHHEVGDPVKAKTVRKWLNEVSKETVERLFVLRIADIEGQSDYQKSEKLAVVRTNLETFSSVLEEEGDESDIVNTLL